MASSPASMIRPAAGRRPGCRMAGWCRGCREFARWILEDAPQGGAFCGAIGCRWQPGTAALPAHVLGHIGYAIVPWKRGAGHAGRALALLLPELAGLCLGHVTLTTDPGNIASQRVILRCGGRLVERFRKPPAYGGTEALRFRIDLAVPPALPPD